MADSPTRLSFSTKDKKVEALEFDIDGEVFVCQPFVPGSVLMEHTARLTSPDVHVAATELLAMWRDILDEGEHERFRKFIDDPKNLVDIQDLGTVLQGVMGELSSRPTQPSSPSARGRAGTGATSRSASKAAASA